MTRLVIRDRAELRQAILELLRKADDCNFAATCEACDAFYAAEDALVDADYSALVEGTAHSGEQGCEDSRRLDWLEHNVGIVTRQISVFLQGPRFMVAAMHDARGIHADSLREAVDAARSTQNPNTPKAP